MTTLRACCRTVALALVFVLLCVPAVTRAGQRLDAAGSRTQPVGFFSKSGDLPPDGLVILPDLAVVAWLMSVPAPQPVATPRIVDEVLPGAPQADTLRAPRPPPVL